MGTDDFYRLFEGFIEEKQLDPITAKWLLERILSILFTNSENQKPKKEKNNTSGKH
ncbi:hypothetical protein [Anaeromassilibacillus sp. An172]|uniref:hypothetical protein n=1 Tax=Anaeromassilibacillus sp. An172 TaxID=1965570 RepID=UPI0013024EB8|nr:hypothetical protein [Anaeromassilibacillus sp. An172]